MQERGSAGRANRAGTDWGTGTRHIYITPGTDKDNTDGVRGSGEVPRDPD